MAKSMKLNIITPGREVIKEDIISLITSESDGRLKY